jgi:hypothetical protein
MAMAVDQVVVADIPQPQGVSATTGILGGCISGWAGGSVNGMEGGVAGGWIIYVLAAGVLGRGSSSTTGWTGG